MARRATLLFLLLALLPLLISAQGSTIPGFSGIQEQEKDRQTPVFDDPAEYNAFLNALNDTDQARRAQLWEEFLRAYPHSAAKMDALEHLLATCMDSATLDKGEGVAERILAIDHHHLRALLAAAYAKRKRAAGMADAHQALSVALEARTLAETGLKVLETTKRPHGVSESDWKNIREQMAFVFYGAAGFGSLMNKEFSHARDFYLKSDLSDLENAFQLARAELEMQPPDVNGFWHAARAVNLARSHRNEAAARQIEMYGKTNYQRYHGGIDGWEELLRETQGNAVLPHGFTVARAVQPAKPAQHPTTADIHGSDPRHDRERGSAQARDLNRDHDHGRDLARDPRPNPCDAQAGVMHRVEKAVPGGVPASVTSFGSDGRAHGVPASVTSPVDGQSHGVPASVTSPTGDCITYTATMDAGFTSGSGTRGVPASITSPVDGQSHGVPASITSIGSDGSLHGIPASIVSPTTSAPVLRVVFGDPRTPMAATVPIFGVRAIRQAMKPKRAVHAGSAGKSASSKSASPPGALAAQALAGR